jgi:hypothetical protein
MSLPAGWNRSRATAIGATLVLHVLAVWWLLLLRFELPEELAEELTMLWQAPPAAPVETPQPPPLATDVPPSAVAPIAAPLLPLPEPLLVPGAAPDWSQAARDVAKGMTTGPSYQPFGEVPKGPQKRPQEQYPPSIWPKQLPRVGTTVETPDGETIIWVSDYCYVSISSRSLTQKEIHDSRKGIRTCILAQFGDKKKARDDLFDPIRRPPPPQEPGCSKEGVGQSCAR